MEIPFSDDGGGAPSGRRAILFPRAAFDLVVIAASAGGVAALKALLSKLPVPFATPIAIVQHLPPFVPSQLSEVLGWRGRIYTKFARHGDRLRAGTIYIAPPDRHLIIGSQGRLELEDSPKLHHVRPAADRLFATAAAQFGPRLLGIVLTGMGRDGAAGAAAIKKQGGVLIVQDPGSAEADAMPRAAIVASTVDLILPLDAVASALTSLCNVIGARELFCPGQLEPAIPLPISP